MHEITRDFLVSLAAFATLFGIVYIIAITRYRERMSIIEKGIDPSIFSSKDKSAFGTLKFGMLAIGIACGILIANLLYKNTPLGWMPAYFSMTFLFGGVSLILNFFIERKLRK